ncbi:MAG: alpha/beta hydrolase [Planctomycetota bacterium]|nr:alpha/beta hydrolase [Planctomycetota bacterium]
MMFIVLLAWIFLPGVNQEPIDPIGKLPGVERIQDVYVVNDVPYARDHARQVMDVAMPTSHEGLLPVVVIIHGGGWAGGDKADVRPFILPTAQGGCLVISPNYRLAPSDPAPAAIHDIKHLLHWLDENAEELGIDRERVALMGFSAGGHLSALAGMTSDTRVLDPPTKDREKAGRVPVRCVASIGGPMELTATFPGGGEAYVVGWAGPSGRQKGGPRALYSPVRWVSRQDPPILLIHGEADPIVPLKNIAGMQSTCSKKDVICEIHIVEDGEHIPELQTYAMPLMRFLDDHLDSSIQANAATKRPPGKKD